MLVCHKLAPAAFQSPSHWQTPHRIWSIIFGRRQRVWPIHQDILFPSNSYTSYSLRGNQTKEDAHLQISLEKHKSSDTKLDSCSYLVFKPDVPLLLFVHTTVFLLISVLHELHFLGNSESLTDVSRAKQTQVRKARLCAISINEYFNCLTLSFTLSICAGNKKQGLGASVPCCSRGASYTLCTRFLHFRVRPLCSLLTLDINATRRLGGKQVYDF